MRRRAASKKPEEAAARPAQPSEGSVRPLSIGAQNAALRAENARLRDALLQVARELMPKQVAIWEQQALADVKRQAMVNALGQWRPKRGRGRPAKETHLLEWIEFLKASGYGSTDLEALRGWHREQLRKRNLSLARIEAAITRGKVRTEIQSTLSKIRRRRRKLART